MRAYPWLGVSLVALADVDEGYKTAYGGPRRSGAIESQSGNKQSSHSSCKEAWPLNIQTDFDCSATSKPGIVPDHRDIRYPSQIEDRGPHFRGPSTPNQVDDLTPLTRGEWSFLLVDSGWARKTATTTIETC